MPRKKKKPDAYDYASYADLASPEILRRAKAAGCETLKEVGEWLDMHYGAVSCREQNNLSAPGPYRRRAKP
jgi:hypothetical protein